MRQSQRANGQLRDEIVAWELQPGGHLNEVRLAQRLNLSPTPLVEAPGWFHLRGGYVMGACCGEHQNALRDHAPARPRSPMVPFEVVPR